MSFFADLQLEKNSEIFFKVFHDKMEVAQIELKNSSTVNTGQYLLDFFANNYPKLSFSF